MTEDKRIRWGIAGTGTIAHQFAADMAYAKGGRLAAVCARDPVKARDFAGSHSGIAAFGALSEMIGSGTVDAIYIATPNMVHRDQALACIEAGMPVMIEKPMTADLDAALKIEAAARAAGSFVMEALWSRYLPAMQAAREAIRKGAIGTVKRIEAELAFRHAYDPASRFFDKTQGGGALHDLGVYPISLTRFFLGEPDAVEGSWRAAASGVDMAASLTLRFADAEAHLSCGFDRDGANRMLIEGDRGTMVIGPLFIKAETFLVASSRSLAETVQPAGQNLAARLGRKLFSRLPVPGVKTMDYRFEGSGLQFEIDAASAAIRQRLSEEPGNTLGDTIAALRIIDRILSQPPSAG